MALVKLNWHPNAKQLRQFGAVFMTGFVLLGLIKYFWPFERLISRDQQVGTWLIALGITVGAIGLTGTRIALPFYWAWLGIAWVLGNVMSRVVITAVYLLVFTPMRLLNKLAGRDRLQLRKPDVDSYWHDISLPRDVKRYERQF